MTTPIALTEIQYPLAEGPMSLNGTYYWVDILNHRLMQFSDRELVTFELEDEFLSSVIPVDENRVLVSGKNALYLVKDMKEVVRLSLDFDMREGTRFNDAKVDPWGNFWIGSMDLNFEEPIGSLFCVDQNGLVKKVLDQVICSNGLAWNVERKSFYYIDSKTQKVVSYGFDPENLELSEPHVVYQETRTEVYPDGMCIDAEGHLYVALWGGGEVLRICPKTKEVLEHYPMPCLNVTSCAFVGEQFDQLMVTTALGDKIQDEAPEAGKVYLLDVNRVGMPTQTLPMTTLQALSK